MIECPVANGHTLCQNMSIVMNVSDQCVLRITWIINVCLMYSNIYLDFIFCMYYINNNYLYVKYIYISVILYVYINIVVNIINNFSYIIFSHIIE